MSTPLRTGSLHDTLAPTSLPPYSNKKQKGDDPSMSENMQWLAILPPLVAITVVLWRKEVILAIFLAILTSELLLLHSPDMYAPLLSFLVSRARITAVFTEPGNIRILLFS